MTKEASCVWQDGEARVLVTAVAQKSLDLAETEDSGGNRGLCLEERQNLICVFVVFRRLDPFTFWPGSSGQPTPESGALRMLSLLQVRKTQLQNICALAL